VSTWTDPCLSEKRGRVDSETDWRAEGFEGDRR
jgi:hypothetical protein